jgi:DNA repair protein RecN (Recombination protein N)
MLTSLRVRDLAVLEDVEVSFGEGLTVLTGETGAGKSLVVDALSLL